MKTCKDCIHYEACHRKDREIPANTCRTFKEKSLVLDLPCKVGDKIYQLDTSGNIYESEITNIIFDTKGIAFDARAIGKNVFLTKEEAEQALKGGTEK